MQSQRKARLASLIQQELSQILLREIKDPRIGPVTLTRVELSPDAQYAKIFVCLLGEMTEEKMKYKSEEMEKNLKGLNSASSFLKSKLTKRLSLKKIPTLSFHEDFGMKNSVRIHELLEGLSSEKYAR